MKLSVNFRRKSRRTTAEDLLATYRRLGMSDDDIRALLDTQRGLTPHEADKPHTCPSCKGRKRVFIGTSDEMDCGVCKGTGQV